MLYVVHVYDSTSLQNKPAVYDTQLSFCVTGNLVVFVPHACSVR